MIGRSVDQRVYLHDVAWEDFERLLAIKGDDPVPRMAYLEGTVELMTPSEDHEAIKKAIARLLEAYAEELGIELEGIGSWTLKRADEKRGVEPDECYSIGRVRGKMPDIAIEVNWTGGGGIDKLDIYRGLGVREVWMWDKDRIAVFVLRAAGYERAARSEILPQVDVNLIESLLDRPTQTAAIRELRARLRNS
jgi:Uma2 family endonuclease